jgi:dTDP-4-amino-4,6-dideoxygalactose transaminase
MQIITIPYANLFQEYTEAKSSIDAAIKRCIDNSSFIGGVEVKTFEDKWKQYTRAEGCAGVSSGTSALTLSLLAVGVKPGDEVIVPGMSFISTAECVSHIGAIPRFVDIDQYYTIDIDQIKNAITKKTRAIIFVDLYGQTIALQRLRALASGIALIQDAAQSAGCQYKGQPIGNQADLTCFSFYPGKNLGAMGDAGAVTGKQKLIANIKMLRDHGRKEKYLHEVVGWSERLDSMQAAILSAKFNFLDAWNQKRVEHARRYLELLKSCDKIQLPQSNKVSSHVYNQFVIQTDRRDDLYESLYNQGIQAGIQFPLAMHQQPVYRNMATVSLPNSERLSARCISLPVHAQLNPGDVDMVAQAVLDFFN